MTSAIRLAADVQALLGEGPLWVEREAALYWVDIKGRRILRLDESGLRQWSTSMRVGSIAPRADGGFIAGTDEGLFALELADEAVFTPIGNPEANLPDNRFNDGKVDRHGHFWAGTMDDTEKASVGSLYRVGPDRRWVKADEGYAVTNGPAFNRAGDILYHTDSARRTIYRFALSPGGDLGPRETFLRFTGDEGYPDGMTVDAEDCLWVAFWDGWAVRRFSPAGEELAKIDVPAQRPTSVAFGGRALDRLYITSARIGLDEAALAAQPVAGGLFMCQPGISGIAEAPFAG